MNQRALYLKAISLNPNYNIPYFLLGEIMSESERIQIHQSEWTKKELFIESIRLQEDNSIPYCLLGDMMSGKEYVTLHGGKQLDKRGLFIAAIEKSKFPDLAYAYLGEDMKPGETISIDGKEINREKCFLLASKHFPYLQKFSGYGIIRSSHQETRFGQWTDFHIDLDTPRKDIQIVLDASHKSNLHLEIRSLRIKDNHVSGMFRVHSFGPIAPLFELAARQCSHVRTMFLHHPPINIVELWEHLTKQIDAVSGLVIELVAKCDLKEVGRSKKCCMRLPYIHWSLIYSVGHASQIQLLHPVIAYHFNEREKRLVSRSITHHISQTHYYTVGRCSQLKVDQMRNDGITVEIQKSSSKFSFPSETESMKHPYYVVQMAHWTMDKEQLNLLKNGGIQLMESITEDTYLCKIGDYLDTTDFGQMVKGIAVYPMEWVTSSTDSASMEDESSRVMKVNVQVFEDNSSEVVKWCKDRGLHENAAGKYVRIEIPLESLNNHFHDLCQLPQVRLAMKYTQPKLFCFHGKVNIGVTIDDPPTRHLKERGVHQIIGISDNYLDPNHPDFAGRHTVEKIWEKDIVHSHGTMVSGCALGSGIARGNDGLDGIAPGAKLYFQQLIAHQNGNIELPQNIAELMGRAYHYGVRIHNFSWGNILPNLQFRYDDLAGVVDKHVMQHPDLLIVAAAGNNGEEGDCTISSPGLCKNVLTIGASEGFSAAPYSSRGHCFGRNKPDLLAPGSVTAASPVGLGDDMSAYSQDQGSSYSAALVSGCAALVREYYTNTRNHQPSAALLKATLVNGTQGDVPNCIDGFGKVDMTQTIPSTRFPFTLRFVDYVSYIADTGSSWSASIRVSKANLTSRVPLRICLCWTDNFLGAALGSRFLLHVEFNENGIEKCIRSGSINSNVLKVIIPNPYPGVYGIIIYPTKQSPQQNQRFALVVTGVLEP